MSRSPSDERKALGAFLSARRGRSDPATFGFAVGQRRTPGLRREEVAAASGVSVSWYTWLEQGRDIKVSSEALQRIASSLHLGPVETDHLFALAGRSRPSPTTYPQPGDEIIELIRAIDPVPAYVRNRRMDILAWNDAVAELFVDYGRLPVEQRNTLWLLFLYPPYRSLIREWERYARGTLRIFRAARAKVTDKVPFDTLIDELSEKSSEFRSWWREGEVQAFTDGVKLLNHPVRGCVDLHYTALTPESWPDLSVVTYLVRPATGE